MTAAAFLPPALFCVQLGAIAPVVPLSATGLGASPPVAAMVVATSGVGQLIADAPAGALTARYGERAVMIYAGVVCVLALAGAMFAASLALFTVAMTVVGMATAVWMLARHTFVADVAPPEMRARAMSTLGGAQRLGLFVGPFIGAAFMPSLSPNAAYGVGIVAALAATAVVALVPEPVEVRAGLIGGTRTGYVGLLRATRRILVTLGIGVLLVSIVRVSRQVVLPLWGEHIGLGPEVIAVIYGLSGAVDMLLFYPAGRIMDLRGRRMVAIVSMLVLTAALLLVPLTTDVRTLTVVALVMGFGNGMSSGLVMTIGADVAPPGQLAEFFGIWRLIFDVGTGAGPLLLAGVTAAASLGVGIVVMGAVGALAAAAVGHWLPRSSTRREGEASR